MGNESSRDSGNDCDHNSNHDTMRYEHHERDSLATIHYKNEANAALDRAESFSPSGGDSVTSAVQSFIDGQTLRNADANIREGCGRCDHGHRNRSEGRERNRRERSHGPSRD